MKKGKNSFYCKYIKRGIDVVFSLLALIVLFPVILVLTIIGAIVMKGNPFFFHTRPGKNEKLFKVIKFRSMTNKKDKNGDFLPDQERLVGYGKFLRKTSLDEIPEFFNILIGEMSIVGPRPLEVCYLPYYNKKEKHRHDVTPGLTGLAQINGRTALNWEKRFEYDIKYVRNVSFSLDLKIILLTIKKVLKKEDIVMTGEEQGKFSDYRKLQNDININK